ncbi:hypothetical protein ACWDA7_46510 [Streptomyces sp. NPDC001156]
MARRGLTDPFWSNVNRYGAFCLCMGKRLDLAPLAFAARYAGGRLRACVGRGSSQKLPE